MESALKELDEFNSAVIIHNHKIIKLNFHPFLDELENRTVQTIKTPMIKDFMKTLGKNKSGSDNSVGRLQFFLNACRQEDGLIAVNPDRLHFINDDHYGLTRGNPGESAADFYFDASDGLRYKIDAKMYGAAVSYFQNLPTTNFHDAEYALVYLISENEWVYSKKSEAYKNLYDVETIAKTDPWLLEIQLPSQLRLLRFHIDLKASDAQIPDEVGYNFYNKSLKTKITV